MAAERPHFELFDKAEQPLIEKFSDRGVVRIEYVAGFVEPFDFSVWLATETDVERDALQANEHLTDEVARVLAGAGLKDSSLLRGVVVQSEETIDRDFEGSWFYAMR